MRIYVHTNPVWRVCGYTVSWLKHMWLPLQYTHIQEQKVWATNANHMRNRLTLLVQKSIVLYVTKHLSRNCPRHALAYTSHNFHKIAILTYSNIVIQTVNPSSKHSLYFKIRPWILIKDKTSEVKWGKHW